ncbi:MAG TPA: membrane-associated protein [Candidatus Peribacter riflensis]|uniref:Membrane-associated protein n=1 Tax=Candidatus Peribacter riflensis TaxID=1735162 RepID=A0A0S1STA1_9BACT|nr:MAG: hypothetical protein PeribacterA2_1059 [Candidatus Peribacter riflensis]OGJ77968.1 MAG: hypothetical protein A2398_01600 [Candidatus Peribacteria bacterium RIFOXYB1_FULL_57_12]OGJ82191.1 MAG: hypothetical protein A2412_03725 [Candidatus Peribacteria bacterium RIFOXYC1_FULL_58_8]ALM11518.1 MAG: hypothetical protein PeribacterB2_1061 [Candidatus Peribacter riflensis]ALM12620.1 MAG: hypothetical protein PeribacterC2_1060 [Candidatus Peribacter riflensis]
MINVKAFALTCGIFWAVGVVLFAALAAKTGMASSFVGLLSEIYLGYGPTLRGMLFGIVWGFLDGLVCGAVFAWLYNTIAG